MRQPRSQRCVQLHLSMRLSRKQGDSDKKITGSICFLERCRLPKDEGRACRGQFQRYYYNADQVSDSKRTTDSWMFSSLDSFLGFYLTTARIELSMIGRSMTSVRWRECSRLRYLLIHSKFYSLSCVYSANAYTLCTLAATVMQITSKATPSAKGSVSFP